MALRVCDGQFMSHQIIWSCSSGGSWSRRSDDLPVHSSFSRTSDLQDVLSYVAVTASLRDIWVSLTILSAQRSGGRPLWRRHDDGGLEARMSMAWVPGCRRQMCPNALRRSLRIVVVVVVVWCG